MTADGACSHEIKRRLLLGRKAITSLDRALKIRHYSVDKGPYSQSYGFSSSHVWMWELDHKEGWVPKNWCFWNVVLEKTLESSMDWKEIKPVNSKAIQSWIFIGRTDLKLKLQYSGHLMWRANLLETCWERLKAGGEEDDRGRDGWMASLTRWTWVWANSRRWWRTGKPGVLEPVGSQRVQRDWAAEQQPTPLVWSCKYCTI